MCSMVIRYHTLSTVTQHLTTKGIFAVNDPNLQNNSAGTPAISVIAMVGGIACLFLPLIVNLTLATPLTIAVLILSIIAAKGSAGRGMAIAGIATCIVALIFQAFGWILFFQVNDAVNSLKKW